MARVAANLTDANLYSYGEPGSVESGSDEEGSVGEMSSDVDSVDAAVVDIKPPRGCVPCFSAMCCCHICYVMQFLIYLIVFPLWAKWLVTSPQPRQYWHEDYAPFPAITVPKGEYIASATKRQISVSDIPTSPTSCNYSCALWRGYKSAEMNFRVSMSLDDDELVNARAHTVYPLLIASADFVDWWVVADRRHAAPQPFWASRTEENGRFYKHVTPACSRPPEEGTEVVDAYAGTYVLACVTWRPDSLKAINRKPWLSYADLGKYCDSVGGVCGWACGSTLNPDRLKGCSAEGTLKVTPNSVAGTAVGGKFHGLVTLNTCEEDPSSPSCTTSTLPFSKWGCHQCVFDPDAESGGEEDAAERRLQKDDDEPAGGADDAGGDADGEGSGGLSGRTIYTSLPRFMVKLHGTTPPQGSNVLGAPRVFVLTSSVSDPNKWKKLYNDDLEIPPEPVDAIKDTKDTTTMAPLVEKETLHAMHLDEGNRLDIEPEWCFGARGPLYLVACALNSTTYNDEGFQFKAGQKVAPPPFNDRCLAVTGRCGHACEVESPALPHCDKNGYINSTLLVGEVAQQKNQTAPVWLFVYTLLIGFAVKVLMLCPGIFRPYTHCRRYSPELTEQLRYMVVCAPSAGENKCTVLRNLVGGIGCMPPDCRCRYHVVFTDEGHRHEAKVMWQKLGTIISAIPNLGGNTYEKNVMQFFHMWVDDTKKMDLGKLEDGTGKVAADAVLERMSGKASLKKLRKEGGWDRFSAAQLAPLEAALQALEENLRDLTPARFNLHRDDCEDWEPKDRNSLPLRMHYLARAKPQEDERTIKAQHVAPGTWYYRVPPDARIEDWLRLRTQAKEMVYGLEAEGGSEFNVPLRTSRGKAGGLNFTENYLTVYAEKRENLYGDDRDDAPCIFSICDARHQFQHDFFTTTLPFFYTEKEELNVDVAFTQCPQYFHEMQDKLDYLDNNNAQFFRLNCMIRNCCGGVSSCGTGGTWMIKHRDNSTVWEAEKKRVRDSDRRKKPQVVERRVFHESCKVEDTASSLQQVLLGRRSQFINRRLSFGMAKAPQDYLAAVQRWAEGGVVLSLQTFLSCHKGVYMVWMAFIFFLCFIGSLFRLVSNTDGPFLIVRLGLVNQATMDSLTQPLAMSLRKYSVAANSNWQIHPKTIEDYIVMLLHLIVWVALLALFLFFVYLLTCVCKGFRKTILFPNEMRWWGRLLISMDNLTYFLWFWTAFFWIGFNYYSVFAKRSYHFNAQGMFGFMLVVQILNWGMVIASSMRYTLAQSMEANEVIMLTMDNIWRSTQLFYITAPLLLYSIIKGAQDYMRYQFYGEDISYWVGGDRGVMSKNLVKYWTLLLILGAVAAWIYYAIWGRHQQGTLSAVLIVTLIALDVLHPCTYLWVGQAKLTREEAAKMTWAQALTSSKWWERRIYALVLNQAATGLLKWLGPAWFVAMPFLTLVMPYIGVNSAFAMLGGATQR